MSATLNLSHPFIDPRVSDLENFSKAFIRIYDKKKNVIPFVYNPIQLDIVRKLRKGHKKLIIIKARQQGVTTMVSSLIFRESITRKTDNLVLTYHSQATEDLRNLYISFRELMVSLPPNFHQYIPKVARDSRDLLKYLETGSTVKFLTAAGQGHSGRGSTLNIVHFTEACFVVDAGKILTGAMQALPKDDGIAIVESTTNGAKGFVYDIVQETLDLQSKNKPSNWELCFYEWWKLPEYKTDFESIDQKVEFVDSLEEEEKYVMEENNLTYEQMFWRRNKLQEIGRLNFQQEYPENIHTAFISTGTGFFQNVRNFENLFCAPRYNTPKPDSSHKYVAGIDWGLKGDYTCVSVIDTVTNKEVWLDRVNNLDWNSIILYVIEILKAWNVSVAYVESNSIGNLIELLWERMQQEGCKSDIQSFYMINQRKQDLAIRLHSAMDNGELVFLPDVIGLKEMRSFIVVNLATTWTVNNPKGHDDTVIARMLANFAREQSNNEMMWVF